jgi:hypothetical protein
VEQEVEWPRDSKWKRIWERKEALGGTQQLCELGQRDWFGSWSPILFLRLLEPETREQEQWDHDQELRAQIEQIHIEQALELVEEEKRFALILPAMRFVSSLTTLTGSELPDEDCPLCLETLSLEESIALPCSKPHCFHRECLRSCFVKARFQCPLCRVDHCSAIETFH